LVPVLTVIGTGIGALGFVIFFGGFILWTRFDSAGLPANEAVAQVPRSDLVVTGASFLVPAFLLGAGAIVLAMAVWDRLIGAGRRRQIEAAETGKSEAAAGLKRLNEEIGRKAVDAERLHEKVERLGNASLGEPTGAARDQARREYDLAEADYGKCQDSYKEAIERERPSAETALSQAEANLESAKQFTRPEHHRQALIGTVIMIAVELYVIFSRLPGLSLGYMLFLGAVAVATVVAAVVAVSMTRHFAWFVVCLFLGVATTVAFAAYAEAHSHASLSPFTAMSGQVAETGFFVAETSDAVYVAKPEPTASGYSPGGDFGLDHRRITLLRLPKSNLSHLTIGPVMEENEAYERSIELADALCDRLFPPGKVGDKAHHARCTSDARLAKAAPISPG
jgi:hypothetical protein